MFKVDLKSGLKEYTVQVVLKSRFKDHLSFMVDLKNCIKRV